MFKTLFFLSLLEWDLCHQLRNTIKPIIIILIIQLNMLVIIINSWYWESILIKYDFLIIFLIFFINLGVSFRNLRSFVFFSLIIFICPFDGILVFSLLNGVSLIPLLFLLCFFLLLALVWPGRQSSWKLRLDILIGFFLVAVYVHLIKFLFEWSWWQSIHFLDSILFLHFWIQRWGRINKRYRRNLIIFLLTI